jgi:hypothetical protein
MIQQLQLFIFDRIRSDPFIFHSFKTELDSSMAQSRVNLQSNPINRIMLRIGLLNLIRRDSGTARVAYFHSLNLLCQGSKSNSNSGLLGFLTYAKNFIILYIDSKNERFLGIPGGTLTR